MLIRAAKAWLRRRLTYVPLAETKTIRDLLGRLDASRVPVCSPYEGDLIFSLIRSNNYRACLETGFHTGSTALYMASAMAPLEGHVLSIALDDDDIVRSSLELLRDAHVDGLHALMRENSNLALTRLHLDGRRFDFIYMDGWKTFDHVVFEIYLFNQILDVGGTIVFDDAYMPAVDQAIKVLVSHYEYEEIDYRKHNQTAKLRAFQILTRGSLKRPYRAFRKQKAISEQSAFRDYRFYRQV